MLSVYFPESTFQRSIERFNWKVSIWKVQFDSNEHQTIPVSSPTNRPLSLSPHRSLVWRAHRPAYAWQEEIAEYHRQGRPSLQAPWLASRPSSRAQASSRRALVVVARGWYRQMHIESIGFQSIDRLGIGFELELIVRWNHQSMTDGCPLLCASIMAKFNWLISSLCIWNICNKLQVILYCLSSSSSIILGWTHLQLDSTQGHQSPALSAVSS